MTANEYQKAALRTESPVGLHEASEAALRVFTILGIVTNPQEDMSLVRLLEGLIGLSGESGEASDILKKTLFQGHRLDREHLARELGDVAWYLALSADAIGYSLEEIFQMNIDKLKERYPDGFEEERSLHRSANDI